MTTQAIQPDAEPCEPGETGKPKTSARSLRGVDLLNFFLADVQTGVGPFLAIYLAHYKWNEQSVGLALTVGGIAGIITQTPTGALVDRTKYKRSLIVVGAGVLALAALLIALFPKFWPVMISQILIGGISSLFLPAVAAITLGLVGHKLFDRRQGRNQSWNSAGNVFAAVSMGLIGYFIADRGIFVFVIVMAIPTVLALKLINPAEIDHDLARGCKPGEKPAAKPKRFRDLLQNKPLMILLACCVLFHFANAAMLPLLGEMLSSGKGATAMMFMSACVVTTQLVITFIASPSGILASRWGRKPLMLIAFSVLPIRGLLYTLTHSTYLLVGIQILDGVGAGIFGVVSVLMIADLTRGTGRFNVAQGAIATAVGIGASLSQFIAGAIVHHSSYRVGFIFLALVAGLAVLILALFMPETSTSDERTAVEPKGVFFSG